MGEYFGHRGPEANGTGRPPSTAEIKDKLAPLTKSDGGEFTRDIDFFETLFCNKLVEGGDTGPIVADHNPADELGYDAEGGAGGGP